jgi:acetyltransferase-like isoleucine patch superfamily enzyme
MAFIIGKGCQIDSTAVIDVRDGYLGDRSIVRAHARIEGQRVEIGSEAFVDLGAVIGGGSCFDPQAFLKAGDWLHMGMNSQINIARGVEIGHEFGCGIDTKIFTHGAYTDSYFLGAPVQWAPVKIGDHVWMPNAWVNPGVEIGNNVIIAARSLVNRDIPSGSLAGGTPATILKENYLPRKLSVEEKTQLLRGILDQALHRFIFDKKEKDSPKISPFETKINAETISVATKEETTLFDLEKRTIKGTEGNLSIYLKDQLRRNGIRFRFLYTDGQWQAWK